MSLPVASGASGGALNVQITSDDPSDIRIFNINKVDANANVSVNVDVYREGDDLAMYAADGITGETVRVPLDRDDLERIRRLIDEQLKED